MRDGTRVILLCPTATALAATWAALDAVEAQARRLPPRGAAAALADYVMAARFAVRQMEKEHDAECPDGCSLGAPP